MVTAAAGAWGGGLGRWRKAGPGACAHSSSWRQLSRGVGTLAPASTPGCLVPPVQPFQACRLTCGEGPGRLHPSRETLHVGSGKK